MQLSVGNTIFAVASYEINSGASNDVSRLWINPGSLGGSERGHSHGHHIRYYGHQCRQHPFAPESGTLRDFGRTPRGDGLGQCDGDPRAGGVLAFVG
jgi:hypothetical protein